MRRFSGDILAYQYRWRIVSMEKYVMGLGKDLVDLRNELGITQELMAKCLGMATSTLRLAEHDSPELSARVRAKLMKRLCQLPQDFPEIISQEVKNKFWTTFTYYEMETKSRNSVLSRLMGGGKVVKFRKIDEEKLLEDTLKGISEELFKTLLVKKEPGLEDNAGEFPVINQELLTLFSNEMEDQSLTAAELLERILSFYFGSKEFLLNRSSDQE
jgi:transcriptional regulator with XRE-family HTH domain